MSSHLEVCLGSPQVPPWALPPRARGPGGTQARGTGQSTPVEVGTSRVRSLRQQFMWESADTHFRGGGGQPPSSVPLSKCRRQGVVDYLKLGWARICPSSVHVWNCLPRACRRSGVGASRGRRPEYQAPGVHVQGTHAPSTVPLGNCRRPFRPDLGGERGGGLHAGTLRKYHSSLEAQQQPPPP